MKNGTTPLERISAIESTIRHLFSQIEEICDDNNMSFYWSGLAEYGNDSAHYSNGFWSASSMSC